MNKKLIVLLVSVLFPFVLSSSAEAISLNFSGNFRTDGSLYSKPNLGDAGSNSTKAFLAGRALLQPNLVIDDHFSLKSQWSLLNSPSFNSINNGPSLSGGQGSYVFGDPNAQALQLSRAWLEWVSDFGVVRVGRMPVQWGYGLIWDAGDGIWDNYQTTMDRLEYRLHFGHVIGALAYSKGRKTSVLGSENDQDFYSIYLQYVNPEMDVEAGVIYERQIRSPSQAADFMTGPANPYAVPAGTPKTGLATKTGYPLSNNVVDLYVKKTIGYLTLGGEGGWLTGSAMDYNNNGNEDTLNAFGLLVTAAYEYHNVKGFVDFMYASGDTSLNSDRLNGFVLLHRNRSPGIILGRELLGPYNGNSINQGSLVAYGDADTFSGAYYVRPGLRVEWAPSWSTGLEVIVAQKAAVTPNDSAALGVEFDLGADHSFYKNFDLGVTVGYLIPGAGLRISSPTGVIGLRTTASIRF